jgi:hypothetical protein
MSEIKLGDRRGPEGDRGPRGHRGEEGERGHRGHRGETGPTGAAGLTGSGGLLKWSGVAGFGVESIVTSFLADTGVGIGASVASATAPAYPIGIARSVHNFATNVLEAVPLGGLLTIELVKNINTVPVVLASTSYTPTLVGVHVVPFGPVALTPFDTLDVAVIATNIAVGLDVSATVGVE